LGFGFALSQVSGLAKKIISIVVHARPTLALITLFPVL